MAWTTPELNWSGTYTYRTRQVHRPHTIDELRRLIDTASGSLHGLGTRHSFNDIADADGLISLEALPGNVTIDENARTVRGSRRDAVRGLGAVPTGSWLGAEQSPIPATHLRRRLGGYGNPWLPATPISRWLPP